LFQYKLIDLIKKNNDKENTMLSNM